MQYVCRVIPTVSRHTEVSLEVRPRHIKLWWEIDNLLSLRNLDYRNCCPSKISSDGILSPRAISTIPVGVSTDSNATIKPIVCVARKHIPLSSLRCCQEAFDLIYVDSFVQELSHKRAVFVTSAVVDVVIKRRLSGRQKWDKLQIDVLIRAEGNGP